MGGVGGATGTGAAAELTLMRTTSSARWPRQCPCRWQCPRRPAPGPESLTLPLNTMATLFPLVLQFLDPGHLVRRQHLCKDFVDANLGRKEKLALDTKQSYTTSVLPGQQQEQKPRSHPKTHPTASLQIVGHTATHFIRSQCHPHIPPSQCSLHMTCT